VCRLARIELAESEEEQLLPWLEEQANDFARAALLRALRELRHRRCSTSPSPASPMTMPPPAAKRSACSAGCATAVP